MGIGDWGLECVKVIIENMRKEDHIVHVTPSVFACDRTCGITLGFNIFKARGGQTRKKERKKGKKEGKKERKKESKKEDEKEFNKPQGN